MSIYHLFCPGDMQRSSLAPRLKSFSFLPVTINNFSKFTFISCYSKKLGISPVKSFYFLRQNGFFQALVREAMDGSTIFQIFPVSIGHILIG